MDVPAGESSIGNWKIDPNTSVARFTMSYLVLATLKGTLGSIEGALVIDEANHGRSAVKASVGVATLNTGSSLRDKHLRSADFFDVARFPKVTFHSSRVEEIGVRLFRVIGDLTIRDFTREVELDAAYDESIGESGSRRARFSATTALSRREFDLGRRGPLETAGFIASDRVTVTLDIRAVAA